jgi:hypothetical protein
LAQKDYPTQKNWGHDKRKNNYNFEIDDASRKEKERRKKDSDRRRSKHKRDNYYDDED